MEIDSTGNEYRHHKAKELAKQIVFYGHNDDIDADTYDALKVIAEDFGRDVLILGLIIHMRYNGAPLSKITELYGKSDRYWRATETHFIKIANGEN